MVMITAEQALKNAKPTLDKEAQDEAIRQGKEFRYWLDQIEEASKLGKTHILAGRLVDWQYAELTRLGFRIIPGFGGKEYVDWSTQPKPKKSSNPIIRLINPTKPEPKPKKSSNPIIRMFEKLDEFFKGNRC